MKRFILALLFMALLAIAPASAADYRLKGVWVSSVYNLDYPSATGLSEAQLKAEADAIIEHAVAWGLDTLFLQVRPAADALYSSALFPWSTWLTGTQGQAPPGDFDPLAYFIERAHGLELEVHAWINPYRITRTGRESRQAALDALSPGHPAHTMADAVLFAEDGCLYFDPGHPEARALIVAGVAEILEGYAVDGIHLDDYFYPSAAFDDSATFQTYGQGYSTVEDFRRASVTQLIRALGAKTRSLSPYAAFGISPFGIWANEHQHPDGSATRGDSSYFSHYADTRGWVQDGLVDYIMPQLYWQIGSDEADFSTLLDWWSEVVSGTGVHLYIGLAAYRVNDAEQESVWYDAGEIIRQFQRMENSAVGGVCLFRYGSLAEHDAVAAFAQSYFAQPPERYTLPYRPAVDSLTLLEPRGAVQSLSTGGFDLHALAPLGSTVHILLDGRATTLSLNSDGSLSARIPTPGDGTARSEAVPMALNDRSGMVCARILPITVQQVTPEQPISLREIFTDHLPDGSHQITLLTGSPVAAQLEQTGTAVKLRLEPCAMAVLFEDDFLEAVELHQTGDAVTYTLLLPVSKAQWQASLAWSERQLTLTIAPPPENP